MRKSILASFTVAALAALLLTGCEREIDMTGRPVEFSAEISDDLTDTRSFMPETRVVYGVEASGAQALDWLTGDRITIYCAQCKEKSSVYRVKEIAQGSTTDMNSYAGIEDAGVAGLCWGTGQHMFYAVYPCTDTDGSAATITGKDITGVIPATQSFTGITGTNAKTVAPDMKNMYMVSKAGPFTPSTSSVTLTFKPLSTALGFTITNKFEDTKSDMKVNSISLVSTGHALNGGFAVDMDQNGSYGRPKTTLASGTTAADNGTVTISFSTPVTIKYGETLNFTFFLNPGNDTEVNDLTFVINGTNAGNSKTFTRRAKLEDKDGHGVTFKTHQKTSISGLMVPEGVKWTINYNQILVTSWDNGIEDDLDME